jgi:hypothetical protein
MRLIAGLLLLGVVSTPTASSPVQETPPLPSIPILVAALDATIRIETFILDGSSAMVDDAKVPSVGGYRIVRPGPIPNVTLARRLIPVVERARDVECGVPRPTPCEFAPRFAFRFHQAGASLDLLVSADCSSFEFVRDRWNASHWISDGRGGYLKDAEGRPLGGLGRSTACISDSLLSICHGLFPKEYDSKQDIGGRR